MPAERRWPGFLRGLKAPNLNPKTVAVSAAGLVLLLAVYLGWQRIYEHHVTNGVGYVYASQLQVDAKADVGAKKAAFFALMRPIIVAENESIAELRQRLIAAREAGEVPAWAGAAAHAYGVEWTGKEWQALLKRVDTAPLALALAQSAKESNWGQSRFAQQGNNMFGQWCFRAGCGMVPRDRKAGKKHKVARYDTVNASVRSYLKNLNTSPAYWVLREIRWQARRQGRKPTASLLAAGLGRYSEQGSAYIDDIRAIIEKNRALMLAADAGD